VKKENMPSMPYSSAVVFEGPRHDLNVKERVIVWYSTKQVRRRCKLFGRIGDEMGR
jgi:hypothetical protein